jgi:hypothetical protein
MEKGHLGQRDYVVFRTASLGDDRLQRSDCSLGIAVVAIRECPSAQDVARGGTQLACSEGVRGKLAMGSDIIEPLDADRRPATGSHQEPDCPAQNRGGQAYRPPRRHSTHGGSRAGLQDRSSLLRLGPSRARTQVIARVSAGLALHFGSTMRNLPRSTLRRCEH